MSDSPRPVVAAFDLDGTITEGGSVFHWLGFIAGHGRTNLAGIRLALPLTIGAIRSSHWADDAKERLFRTLLAGRDFADVTERSRSFALEHLATKGRSHVLARLRWHLAQGHDVVIVSASPQLYVDVLADALAVMGGCGTRLAVDDAGRLTGYYDGKNCRGTEKMRRLSQWIEDRRYLQPPVIYAYGNSRGDRRLLAMADYPYDVGSLGRFGALRQHPRLPRDYA